MNAFIENLFSLTICVSPLILAVLILRQILKKAPKWVNVLLWGIVAFSLICTPLLFGLFGNSGEQQAPPPPASKDEVTVDEDPGSTVPVESDSAANIPAPTKNEDTSAQNKVVVPINRFFLSFVGATQNLMDFIEQYALPFFIVWLVGTTLMLTYAFVSYWDLRRKVATAVRFVDHIYQSENAGFPFVLGLVKPRIYLPFKMNLQDLEYVIAHEQAHIRRKDHWWKPLGFVLLTFHWLNPLMWLAYILLCRDIELACDEKVIRKLGCEQRADYTQALVSCSVKRRTISACPLAFGAVGVKDRVKAVMNYRKPRLWIRLVSAIICIAVSVCALYTMAMAVSLYKSSKAEELLPTFETIPPNMSDADSIAYAIPGGIIHFDPETGTVTGYEGTPVEVHIPAKIGGVDVVAIGDGAFMFCSSLTNVSIQYGMKTIGAFAFAHCPNLINIDIPNSVDSIGRLAFRLCERLTSIILPEGLQSIGNEAFAYCSSLTNVAIPASVGSIGAGAFFGCSKLEAIRVAEGNPNYYSNENGVLFNKNQTELHSYPAALVGSYTVPSGIVKIGAYAFSGCNLSRVIIPNGVTGIDTAAFYHCSNLTHITLPDTITAIGSNAFFKCASLTEISFGGSATKWGQLDKGNNNFSGAAVRCTVQTPDFVF